MNPGIIFCAWGTKDLVEQSLAPWVELRRQGKATICAVSVKFASFEGEDDGTRELLRGYLERGDIDHLVDGPDNALEVTARGMALTWLREQGVEATWMIDADEFYTHKEIARIIDFVTANPWVVWFRISLKNMVFDSTTYLAEPFQPPRIHRVCAPGGYLAAGFHSDNGVYYERPWSGEKAVDERYASLVIPPEVAWIRHESWPNSLRSKSKIEYQTARWGNVCSFAWDDAQGGLIFNPKLPPPKVIHES